MISYTRRLSICLGTLALATGPLWAGTPEASVQQPQLPLGLQQEGLQAGQDQEAPIDLLERFPAIRPFVWWHPAVSPEHTQRFVRSRDRKVWTF